MTLAGLVIVLPMIIYLECCLQLYLLKTFFQNRYYENIFEGFRFKYKMNQQLLHFQTYIGRKHKAVITTTYSLKYQNKKFMVSPILFDTEEQQKCRKI